MLFSESMFLSQGREFDIGWMYMRMKIVDKQELTVVSSKNNLHRDRKSALSIYRGRNIGVALGKPPYG